MVLPKSDGDAQIGGCAQSDDGAQSDGGALEVRRATEARKADTDAAPAAQRPPPPGPRLAGARVAGTR